MRFSFRFIIYSFVAFGGLSLDGVVDIGVTMKLLVVGLVLKSLKEFGEVPAWCLQPLEMMNPYIQEDSWFRFCFWCFLWSFRLLVVVWCLGLVCSNASATQSIPNPKLIQFATQKAAIVRHVSSRSPPYVYPADVRISFRDIIFSSVAFILKTSTGTRTL